MNAVASEILKPKVSHAISSGNRKVFRKNLEFSILPR
jgi:hypothetical protein